MFTKKTKSFVGSVGSGLPYEDLETALNEPLDSVMSNLDRFRPMVKAIREMAQMDGWSKYVQPMLEKRRNPTKLLAMIKEGKDVKTEAAVMEAYGGLLNLVGSILRTGDSIDRSDLAKAAADAARVAAEMADDPPVCKVRKAAG